MNPKFRKWFFRPLLALLIVAGVLVATVFVVLSTQQQRLVNLAVAELNKQVKGELAIADSRISIFRSFPYVSIVLNNGQFYADKGRRGKPILVFDRLYVGFSLPDMLEQRYDIKMLVLQGGHLDIVQTPEGRINLMDMEAAAAAPAAPPDADTSAAISIDLQKIVVRDVDVSFHHQGGNQMINTRIASLTSSFKIDSARLAFAAQSDLRLDVVHAADTIFRDKQFHLDLEAAYGLASQAFNIDRCRFTLGEAAFTATGHAAFADTTFVDFRILGDKQNFNLFTAFVPDDVENKLKPFQYDGRLYFDAFVKGKLSEGQMPLIEVMFGCEDAWFLNTGANKKVDQLGFHGFYTNGAERNLRTSEVHVMNVSARPEKGVFKGNFVVRDFTAPRTLVQVRSELELKFLGEFLGIHDLKQITGKIKLDMDFKEFSDIKLPEESLNKLKEGVQSKLIVENLSFRIPNYPHAVRDMNIRAEMRNGRVTVDAASLKIGTSDLTFSGSVSDIRAFLRDHDKPIRVALHAGSDQLVLPELLAHDTALANSIQEEVRNFTISLALETTVRELLHPSPLPKGKFEMKNLRASFKNYPHTLRNLGATVLINDTLLRLREFTGMIDSSDINMKGRVTNYKLWFDDIKKGRTQIAFDFRSNRFAMKDVLARGGRRYVPRGYRREVLANVWLRSKIDLRYDTVFRFAKARIANVTADLTGHKLKLKEISGGVKYGAKVLALDTLRGKIGNSDFDVSLKYYFKGVDRYNNKVANSLNFHSKFLDIDEMSGYDLAPKKRRSRRDTTAVAKVVSDSVHKQAFNIFMIPFSDFNAQVSIGKVKYNRLWLKDVVARLHMQRDQTIAIDTLMLQVAGGTVRMRGRFNGSNPDKIYFRSRIVFDQVDLAKMMVKLDHFGQDVVVNKNIKGRLSGQIRSYVQVHPDLVPIVENSKAEMRFSIYHGSLVDFAPLQAMASYFKDKNLRLIRFDTLHNTLKFANGVLDIPAMNINSSLGYIQVSGKQSIDLNMEYYIRVPMKMVTKVGFSSLFKGRPDAVDLEQVDEIEYMDKDRKIAFMNLKVTGTPGDFKVGLGKDKRRKL